MNAMYRAIGITKQAFHQKLERDLLSEQQRDYLLQIIHQLREDHPTMGCRDMYFKLQPECMGRDKFEAFCREEGLMSKPYKNPVRTTNSLGVTRFENLTVDLKLTNIDQLWVSDITYFEVNRKFYYLTFIMDAFSRRILGHSTSERLFTKTTTLPALRMAIKTRKSSDISSVIFHSDGGGQYYAKEFLEITRVHKIRNSMCEYTWENGKAERINGVIKNNYLIHRIINNFVDLKKEVDRSVKLYNHEKPHIGLQRKSPIIYEKVYLCEREKSEAEQSTTEYKNYKSEGHYSPPVCREKSSTSHITQEYKNSINQPEEWSTSIRH